MPTATFRFYGSLADFLAPSRRGVAFEHAFDGAPAVKDVLEALGPPHVELALVTLDGAPVGLEAPLRPGVRVAAYPCFTRLPLPTGMASPCGGEPRFLLDVHLGKLARHLRLLGFDAAWSPDADDPGLARRAAAEE